MSSESLNDFMERMKNDREFAKKVIECKDSKERMQFVRESGYRFTPEEVSELKEEIHDDQLDRVTGGLDLAPDKICFHTKSS